MAADKSKLLKETCPFWALENTKECGIAKGGMYIPMPDHIRIYCLSSKYHQCRQYINGCEANASMENNEINQFLGSRDRRRLRRYPEHLYLDIIIQDRKIGIKVINTFKAKSLDVSLGGLRVESTDEFPTNSVVSFVMDPDFSSDSLLGFGEIKWCELKEHSNKYESGIAFSSYSTSESVREYLDI